MKNDPTGTREIAALPFRPGQRVRILPHSDFFMMGECYGSVVSIGPKWIVVAGERSGRKYRFSRHTDALEAA